MNSVTAQLRQKTKFRKLSEILKIRNGKDYKSISTGTIPVYGSGGVMTYISESLYDKPSVLIPRKGSIGNLFYIDIPFWTVDTLFYTEIDTTLVIPKYVYYCLQKENLEKLNTAGGVPSLTQAVLNNVSIPVPPLPIQEEIVRILDTFTELTVELTEELTAELTARKKQYSFYQNKFFGKNYDEMIDKSHKENIKLLSFDELGTFTRGKRFVRDDIRANGIPCIHYGDLYTHFGISATQAKGFLDGDLATKMRFANKNDLVIVQAGENKDEIGIGVAWLGDEKVAVHDACYIFKHNINPKYISYFLRASVFNLQVRKYVSEGKICSISAKNLGKALIPVPPLSEQQRIVLILDTFNSMVNDINIYLPAEIEARKKQYEYYRDKLLTFKELKQ